MTEARPSNYWIASNALYITLNANGGPDYLLGNTASGAHILCYMKGIDGLEYDAGHNYRRWPLSLTPTHFETYTEKYVYCAIPRPGNAAEMAVIVFPSEHLDIYGKNEIGQQIGSEQYYYIWLQGIISSSGVTGANDRGWTQHVDTGTLASDEAMNAGGDETWWRYSAVDDTVTFLKEIVMDAKSVFHNLKARLLVLAGHELTGVATADTSDEFVDSETLVVTPSYLKKNTEDKFLRKDQDDATPYSLTVGGNLSVGGILRAVTGYFTSLYSNLVQSTNYTGEGIADTGYRLTADDGTGSSALTVDNLHVRKKATFEELEVKKETSVAGNEIRSAAANVINRTDYIDQNGEVIGYSYHTVPWMLRKMPFLLRHKFFGRLRRVRITIDPEHVGDIKKIRCYFLAKDGDRDVKNLWQAHDLVRCQTFNISRSNRFTYIGTASQSKAGNVFWWRKAVLVSTSPVAIDDKEYHYFDVSMDDCAAGSDIPCAGDHAVQFGNDSDDERMNLIIQEVNGTDAPAIKAYTGIYTYDLNKCWWGGSPRKMMLSPKQGYEFYGPSFKFVQEYGQAPASIDRGVWSEIPTERDDYAPHDQVRKCYYYDKVSHNGCYWLCVMSQVGAHWVDASGNYLTQAEYDALPEAQKALCTRKQNYVTSQPGTDDTAWKKLVDKGDNMIRLDIDNEMDTVQTDSTGKVTAQRTVTTVVRLYDGSSEVAIGNPTVTGISYTDANGQQQTLNPVITASGNGRQLSWTFQQGWTLQGRYQVSIGYTYQNVPYTAVFTLTASQGLAIFQLKPAMSSIPFQRDADGNLTPASKSLALDIIKIDGASTATITPATYGRTKIRYSLTEMPTLVTSGTAWPSTGSISVPNTAENVYIALFNIYDGLIDRESVPVIKDGEKGQKGDSITKQSEVAYYIKNTTGVRPAENDPNWSTTKPTIGKGEWLFTKIVITWSDTSKTVLYTDERNPNDGAAGQDIIVDGATEMKYYVGDSNTTHPAEDSSDWKDLSQVTQTQGKWLWSKATTWYRKASSAAGSKDAGHSVNYNVSYISKDGKTGRGISSITEYYQATNSSAARQKPTSESGWDTDPNLSHLTDKWDANHKYLWNMEKTVYTNVDGSTATEYSIPQILAIWTKDGAAGRGIDSIQNKYCVTSSSTTPAKEGQSGAPTWYNTPLTPGQGQYLWNYEIITWVNGTPATTETDVQMIGYAGTDGKSITKQSEVAYYIKNTTGVRPAENDPNWSTTKPTIGKGEWLFTKIVITWSDTSKTVLYTDERNPNDGAAGQDIIVDGATEMKYYVGDSNTTHPAEDSSDWKDLSQVTQTQGKWLWSKATTWYRKASSAAGSKDAGHSVNYNVSYISKDGKTGRGISSITEYYQATNSSAARQKPTSESGWDTDPNLSHRPSTEQWDANHKYLWNMEKTVYTNVDGSTTTEYSIPQILAIWTKDGNPGRGIDSIQNKYCVTSSSTTPAKEGQSGAPTWYNTPLTPGQGQYLWNYEIITWINPSGTTSTDVQMIGYAGTNGRTPEKGVDYDDGYTVICEPSSLVINQGAGNVYDISTTNPAYFKPKVTKGTGTTNLVTAVSVSANYCVKNNRVDIVNIGTWSSANGLPVTGVNATAISNKYTQGYLVLSVTADGKTFSVTIPIAVNYLGTYIETIVDGKKTEIANLVVTEITEDGTFVVNDSTYQGVKTAAQAYDQWTKDSVDNAGSYKYINKHLSDAEGNISTVGRKIPNPDLFNSTAWIVNTKVGSEFKSADYDSQNARFYDASHSVDDIYSPIVALSAGKYTFSGFVPSDRDFETSGNTIVLCSGFTKPDESYTSIPADSVGVVSGEKKVINGATYHRCFATFTLSSAAKCSINLWGSARDGQVAYPKLEKGSDPTYMSIDSASYIKQTADEIEAKVNDTGINISTREVTVFGGKFKMKPDKNSDATFELDENGNLVSRGSAQFEGKVKATSGEFTGKITATSGEFTGVVEISSSSGSLVVGANNKTYFKIGPSSEGHGEILGFAGSTEMFKISLYQSITGNYPEIRIGEALGDNFKLSKNRMTMDYSDSVKSCGFGLSIYDGGSFHLTYSKVDNSIKNLGLSCDIDYDNNRVLLTAQYEQGSNNYKNAWPLFDTHEAARNSGLGKGTIYGLSAYASQYGFAPLYVLV